MTDREYHLSHFSFFELVDSAGSVVQSHDSYCVTGTQHQSHRNPLDSGERKLPRPIGTERALTRRTPAPPLPATGFPPTDLGLWGFGNPSAELGPSPQLSAMNPTSLPPGLTHGDWLTLSGYTRFTDSAFISLLDLFY